MAILNAKVLSHGAPMSHVSGLARDASKAEFATLQLPARSSCPRAQSPQTTGMVAPAALSAVAVLLKEPMAAARKQHGR